MYLAEQVDIDNIYAHIGNNEDMEFQLKLQNLQISALFVTTPNLAGTGPNLTTSDHVVITEKFSVLNEKSEAFAWVPWLGEHIVPYG
jgi:hypothetical protein